MDYTKLPLFSLMKAKLNYGSERQAVLAQNVANADTPGYRAKDVKEPDFKQMLSTQQGLAMTATNPGHVIAKDGASGAFEMYDRPSTYELSPVGNNVSITEEMQRVAQNQSEYQRVLNLYRKSVMLFKTALGTPNNG